MGMSFMTSVQALAISLDLDIDPQSKINPSKPPVLVWGGSTACGHFAIQLLKQSGHPVATTASKRSMARIEALGADLVVAREDIPAAVQKIKETFPDLKHALDCVAQKETAEGCAEALGDRPSGRMHTLIPVQLQTSDVKPTFTLVYTTLGKWMKVLEMVAPPIADAPLTEEDLKTHRALMAKWYSFDQGLAYPLLRDKRLLPMEIERWEGGLEGIQSAIDAMRDNKWSGAKIVHTVAGESS
jgi:threonine dehydrogenase-like Zn-dependent dehydrogenase